MISTAWRYGDDGLFGLAIGAGERLAFSNLPDQIRPYYQDSWNPRTLVTNAAFDAIIGNAFNDRYVSATQINLTQDTPLANVDLTIAYVDQDNCTLKFTFEDNVLNTTISNGLFYAYDGVTQADPPANVVFVAFEHYGLGIGKDTAAGAGKAWDATSGIGGSGNGLILQNQASASLHEFHIGLSAMPTHYGKNMNIKFCVQFDVE